MVNAQRRSPQIPKQREPKRKHQGQGQHSPARTKKFRTNSSKQTSEAQQAFTNQTQSDQVTPLRLPSAEKPILPSFEVFRAIAFAPHSNAGNDLTLPPISQLLAPVNNQRQLKDHGSFPGQNANRNTPITPLPTLNSSETFPSLLLNQIEQDPKPHNSPAITESSQTFKPRDDESTVKLGQQKTPFRYSKLNNDKYLATPAAKTPNQELQSVTRYKVSGEYIWEKNLRDGDPTYTVRLRRRDDEVNSNPVVFYKRDRSRAYNVVRLPDALIEEFDENPQHAVFVELPENSSFNQWENIAHPPGRLVRFERMIQGRNKRRIHLLARDQ